MRLLTRRIHRAFPQLDPYSDEVCWKFIDAARGTKGVRNLSRLSVALVGLVLTPVGCALWMWMFAALIGLDPIALRTNGWKLGLWILAIPFTLGLGPAAAYFWRDRLLGWRLKYVLGTSGRCPACQYSLIGLALTDQSTVFCPECGAECEVDPSLGELARGTTGRIRTKPAGEHASPEDLVFKRPPLLSPGKRRLIKRTAIALALLVFVVLPGAAGLWELMIRQDAARAAADLARIRSDLRQLLSTAGLAPEGSAPDGRSTADAFARVIEAIQRAGERWEQIHSTPERDVMPPMLDVLVVEDFGVWTAQNQKTAEEAELERAGARELMQLCAQAGAADLLAAVADSTPEAPRAPAPEQLFTAFTTNDGMHGPIAVQAYLDAWDHELRRDPRPDPRDLLRLIDIRLGLARIEATSPLYNDKQWAIRSEVLAYPLILDLLASHPDAPTLDALGSILDRRAYDPRLHDAVEWSRLTGAAAIASLFSQHDEVRFGPLSRFARSASRGPMSERRLGWYLENRDLVMARGALPAALFAQDEITRPFAAPTSAQMPLPAAMYAQGHEILLSINDGVNARRRGIRTLLALEKHRAAKGAYPAQLDDLIPAFLPSLPLDPWSGKPFLYAPKPTPPAGATRAWPFVLYSVGADRTDNGGVASQGVQRTGPLGLLSGNGADEVVNPERPRLKN